MSSIFHGENFPPEGPPWERPESSRRATAMALVTSAFSPREGKGNYNFNLFIYIYIYTDVDRNSNI